MADAHTPLISAPAQPVRLAFPLGLCSERVRPYVELIRFQKVSFTCGFFRDIFH